MSEMDYSLLAEYYEKLESTTKRLEMTSILSELFKSIPPEKARIISYLTTGRIAPDFSGIELGMAESLVIKSVAFSSGAGEAEVTRRYHKSGDIGSTGEELLSRQRQKTLFSQALTLDRVLLNMKSIATAQGAGSQDLKIKLLCELLHDAAPNEAKYILRTVMGRLRLGIAEMTLIDSLAAAYATKEERHKIEEAYNRCSDIGMVAEVVASKGIGGLDSLTVQVGIPLRPMLCERLSGFEEIFGKLGENGKSVSFEYKYDGLRIQAHVDGQSVKLFSRRLEDVTGQFPDIIENIITATGGRKVIVEGECVPVNLQTGELLPFQQVSHRRGRKHGLSSAVDEYPVHLFLFDILYLDGKDMLGASYTVRREKLEEIITPSDNVIIAKRLLTASAKEAEEFFNDSLFSGCEGIIAKSISENSVYKAGSRGWNWVKYKRDYKAEMADTVDLCIVGAFHGRGRRSGKYGALLMAGYNNETGDFETVCKLGSGLSDKDLEKLSDMLPQHVIKEKDKRVVSDMKPDIWISPAVVLEVSGAEITLSPIHTCGRGALTKDSGLAIRFPRFTGRYRDDRDPEQSTSAKEIIGMYKIQLKRIQNSED